MEYTYIINAVDICLIDFLLFLVDFIEGMYKIFNLIALSILFSIFYRLNENLLSSEPLVVSIRLVFGVLLCKRENNGHYCN